MERASARFRDASRGRLLPHLSGRRIIAVIDRWLNAEDN